MITVIATSLVPVVGFLVILHYLDTYRLLPLRRIMQAIGAGGAAALICWPLNFFTTRSLGHAAWWYAVIAGPILEEAVKGAYLYWQIREFRIAFMADSATAGFAVGTGFALVENIYYAFTFTGEPASVWVVRGLGTAIMHGGATALFGLVTVMIRERSNRKGISAEAFALALPIAIHSFYNSHIVRPNVAAACILAGVPLLLVLAFQTGEESIRRWVRQRMDRDIEILDEIREGRLANTESGRYLMSLTSSLPPLLVVDMVRVMELRAELSVRAKADLMRREASLPVDEFDPETEARFSELAELRDRIGKTGMLALRPLLVDHARDLWEARGMGLLSAEKDLGD